MAHRSFKHILVETSLERKCLVLFFVVLFAVITGSFWWYGGKTEGLVYDQTRERGRLLVDTILTLHHLEHLDAGSDFRDTFLVPFRKEIWNDQYSWEFIGRRHPKSGMGLSGEFDPRLWDPIPPASLPAAAPAADDLGDAPPAAETTAEAAPADAAPVQEIRAPFDERYSRSGNYYYFEPVYSGVKCAICHNGLPHFFPERFDPAKLDPVALDPASLAPFAEGGGDVVAVVKVIMPYGPIRDELNTNRAILLGTAVFTAFLSVVASYLIIRFTVVKPLKHLREVSDAVSHGNVDLRAEIKTGDEFEALGVAFNRMLRHLVAAHEELRNLNVDLDQKVDELAQVNLRLFEMNRLKSDFLATMSHELRTPLNSIIGFSDVLGSIDSLDERQKRYVQNIQKSGKVLLDMINDILDLAKIESGKADMRLTDFRIGMVLGAQCDMARPLTERKNIDLEVDVQPGLPELRQDQGKVQQVLNNLLSNAIKFTPEGGRIVVAARRADDDFLELVVTDTGVGIAEEDQARIFEKFRQGTIVLPGGDAMTREYSGTGLGLSIVKELCKLLGGEILLRSELGKGSAFTVRIPWTLTLQPRLETPVVEPEDGLARLRPEFDGELIRPAAAQ